MKDTIARLRSEGAARIAALRESLPELQTVFVTGNDMPAGATGFEAAMAGKRSVFDAVDTGRRTPERGVPCFSSLVATLNHEPEGPEELLEAYETAVTLAARVVRGRHVAAGVRALPETTLLDVLAHEFAHLAAYARHGRGIRPHGREWAGLMRSAGFPPRVRFADEGAIDVVRAHARIPVRYLHRCPVCGAARETSRPMQRWRCGACYESGLNGLLEIVRVAG